MKVSIKNCWNCIHFRDIRECPDDFAICIKHNISINKKSNLDCSCKEENNCSHNFVLANKENRLVQFFYCDKCLLVKPYEVLNKKELNIYKK